MAWCAAFVPFLLAPTTASALELTLDAFEESEYSTNINRVNPDGDEDGGWVHQPGGVFGAEHESEALTIGALYSARRRFYDSEEADDDTSTVGSGHIEWRVLPELLTLDASNTRTESTISPRGSLAPGNRQDVSSTVAGGTLSLPSFGRQHLDLGYHYDFYSSEETASGDSLTQHASAAYVIPFSTTRSVSLRFDRSDVDFENDLSPDYVNNEASVNFVAEGADLDLDLGAGYSEVDRTQGQDNTSGATGHAGVTWRASPDSTGNLTFARAFDSRSPRAWVGIPDPGQEITDDSSLDAVYVRNTVVASWTQVVGRNQFTFGAHYLDVDYEDLDNDQQTTGVNLEIERRLRPTVRGSLFTTFDHIEYDSDGREDDDWDSGVQISWEGFQRLTISLAASYYERSSDASSSEYEEWRGTVSLSYRLLGTRVASGLGGGNHGGAGRGRPY